MKIRAVVSAGLLVVLAACGKQAAPPPPARADWLISSKVLFVNADRKTARAAPAEPFKLWMPYVLGDLYGAPTGGELEAIALAPDLSFRMDLNQQRPLLEKALIKTAFSQSWMQIEPAAARMARLSPFLMPRDGITPLGVSEWIDADSSERVMLLYVDRPAHILGAIVYEGRSLRFDIAVPDAGYVWVQQPDDSGTYRAVAKPANLALAVMPNR